MLVTPEGHEAGRVRKQTPAAFEGYLTRAGEGPHVLETALGRIGVGICFEAQLAWFARLVASQSIDLLLLPHSAVFPPRGPIFSQRRLDVALSKLASLAPFYAGLLGAPVVLCNKSGPFASPIPGLPIKPRPTRFPGLSTIVDSDGNVKGRLGADEGVLVAEVALDPRRKKTNEPTCHGRWAREMPFGAFALGLIESLAARSYRKSTARKKRALSISSLS